MKFVIYKHTNIINNKCYVGYTSHTLEYRWKGHVKSSKKPTKGNVFHFAIKKYGMSDDVWTHEILEELDTLSLAKMREIYWIEKLNCVVPNGYNMTHGGEGPENARVSASLLNHKHIQETKDKISFSLLKDKNPNYGHPRSEEICLKISQSNLGKIVSSETREKISISKSNKPLSQEHKNKLSKKVEQLDEFGNIIELFDSLTLASKKTGIDINHISRCCNGIIKSKRKYDWRFQQ